MGYPDKKAWFNEALKKKKKAFSFLFKKKRKKLGIIPYLSSQNLRDWWLDMENISSETGFFSEETFNCYIESI